MDEGNIGEKNEKYKASRKKAMDTPIQEAAKVYLLMTKNIPISRSARFQWLLDHLNCVITIEDNLVVSETSDNLEIISVVPTDDILSSKYLVTNATEVIFLAQTYRFVYCLDMSPSQSAVDITQGEILFDEIINCFRSSLLGLCRQFTIPGNSVVFQPCLYLTVIVNTPFFISPAQQVLIKGVQVSSHNVQDIVNIVQGQFHHLEGRIADVSALAYDQMDLQIKKNEILVSGLYDLSDDDCMANIPMVSPDANFVNMLRYSMLAIALLPENSLSHILVITDGVVAMPDSNIMESILYQLHYDSIALSFLKVGSCFHSNSSAGYVSYTDLLVFLSHSTLGSYLDVFPVVKPEPTFSMNLYQELYLLWTYNCKDKTVSPELLQDLHKFKTRDEFQPSRLPTLLSKRQTEENVNASLLLLVSRRMREGYTVNEVCFINGMIEVKLSLHWKSFIYIHYMITSQWPISKNVSHLEVFISAPYDFLHDITCLMKRETKSSYRQAVFERFWVRMTQLTTAEHSTLAHQLSAMRHSTAVGVVLAPSAPAAHWYTLPDSVRNGIPVFILNGGGSTSSSTIGTSSNCNLSSVGCLGMGSAGGMVVGEYDPSQQLPLTASDSSCQRFCTVWLPICQLHTSHWRKWFHTHKLSLVLRHDHPLPRHMHLANTSGRFQLIQCRQAATSLYRLLATWSSFTLIDNHTYLKFLTNSLHTTLNSNRSTEFTTTTAPDTINIPPAGFCIVRVTARFPCVTLHLGFVTGTAGHIRYGIVAQLKTLLAGLTCGGDDRTCCTLMQKPLEKILIKYERMPNDFHTVIFPDGTEPPYSMQSLPPSPLAGTLFTTLSRYLFHQRWIWSTTHASNPKLGVPAISRILNTLTRMRLREGFKFAHSVAGIITMVLELAMSPNSTCVVQYVLFPPHSVWWGADGRRMAEDDEDDDDDDDDDSELSGAGIGDTVLERDAELQMVTEVWIEPQYGCVRATCDSGMYMRDKYYYELADLIRLTDMRCINALLTLEHLSLMSQEPVHINQRADGTVTPATVVTVTPVDGISTVPTTKRPSRRRYNSTSCRSNAGGNKRRTTENIDNTTPWNPFLVQRIQHIAFRFEPITILPLCRQTELLFSMFIENSERSRSLKPNKQTANKLLLDNLHRHLYTLHDQELDLTALECRQLAAHIATRIRKQSTTPHSGCGGRFGDNGGAAVFVNDDDQQLYDDDEEDEQQTTATPADWRCFVKGVSVTHVILTFVPARLDVTPVHLEEVKDSDRATGRDEYSDSSDGQSPTKTPPRARYGSSANRRVLPLYIYDCPLAALVESYVQNTVDKTANIYTNATGVVNYSGDVYEDHRYSTTVTLPHEHVRLHTIPVKLTESTVQGTTTTHHHTTTTTTDSTASTSNAARQHCRALHYTHARCYTVSLFAALHAEHYVHAADVQAVVDRCEASATTVDISEYLRTICGHLKQQQPSTVSTEDIADGREEKSTSKVSVQHLCQPSPCIELGPLHRLIRDKFLRVTSAAFRPIPGHKEFYYFCNMSDKQSDTINATTTNNTTTSSTCMLHTNGGLISTVSSKPLSNSCSVKLDTMYNSSTSNDGQSTITTSQSDSVQPTSLDEQLLATGGLNEDAAMVSPLFLHFICTVKYEGNVEWRKSVKLLPTCLGELVQNFNSHITEIDKSKLNVSLDMVCLTLPTDIQNVINDYTAKGLRNTSFCSDSFVPSTNSSASDASFNSDIKEPEQLCYMPELQRLAISSLKTEIKWLLRDEIATALLDIQPVTLDTLNLVMQHVTDSVHRPSCLLDTIHLHFVYDTGVDSHRRFVDEFARITVPSYCLTPADDLYYLAKDHEDELMDSVSCHDGTVNRNDLVEMSSHAEVLPTNNDNSFYTPHIEDSNSSVSNRTGDTVSSTVDRCGIDDVDRDGSTTPKQMISEDVKSYLENDNDYLSSQSDLSSGGETSTGTGYDEDVSDDDEGFDWLVELSNKRAHLPNFWLIMHVNEHSVRIYFHCRFLELSSVHIGAYTDIHRAILTAIRDLCKKVNQSLLLQSLYLTRLCNPLLEADDNSGDNSRNLSYTRLKSMEENFDELEVVTDGKSIATTSTQSSDDIELNLAYLNSNLSVTPATIAPFYMGEFSCPVVCEVPFVLHPRLKAGAGKSSLTIAVAAMKSVLDKFSVQNRSNIFVYQDVDFNVFYLRLVEEIQTSTGTNRLALNSVLTDYDQPVSRSPSIASLPIGHQKSHLARSDFSLASTMSGETRPRVRSFGEKESKEGPNVDLLILKVHGIQEAGDEIRKELVQVLQNRLDDAVLEFLSIMLARNAMCPLTPEDVHFLQKPFRAPEMYLSLSIQNYATDLVDAFGFYLKQNLSQFLNVPKYTDPKSLYHFKDYDHDEHVPKSDDIYIYNQSHNPTGGQPTSGHHSIAVISVAIIDRRKNRTVNQPAPVDFNMLFERVDSLPALVATEDLVAVEMSCDTHVQFRVWRQGRLNRDLLYQKLRAAAQQAHWDLICEYYLLSESVCEVDKSENNDVNINEDSFASHNIVHNMNLEQSPTTQTQSVNNTIAQESTVYSMSTEQAPINMYQAGLCGKLSPLYAERLTQWLDFAVDLNSSAVKKILISTMKQHMLHDVVNELRTHIVQLCQPLNERVRCFLPMHGGSNSNVYQPVLESNGMFLMADGLNTNAHCLMMVRNFDTWRFCVEGIAAGQWTSSQINKVLMWKTQYQKFMPMFVQDRMFVPRQKLLWVTINQVQSVDQTQSNVIMYAYNWSKDHLDKFLEHTSLFNNWLITHVGVLNTGVLNTLGLKHHPITDEQRSAAQLPQHIPLDAHVRSVLDAFTQLSQTVAANSQQGAVSTVTVPPVSVTASNSGGIPQRKTVSAALASVHINGASSQQTVASPAVQPPSTPPPPPPPVVLNGVLNTQSLAVRRVMGTIKDNGVSNLMRDRYETVEAVDVNAAIVTELMMITAQHSEEQVDSQAHGVDFVNHSPLSKDKHRFRIIHFCHTPMLFLSKWRLETAATRDMSLFWQRNERKQLDSAEDKWHRQHCLGFMQLYKDYIVTLKFVEIRAEDQIQTPNLYATVQKQTSATKDSIYMHRILPCGHLIFVIDLLEPFVSTKLCVIERLQPNPTCQDEMRHKEFVRECDSIKVLMHLHSFTYDFHLRSIYNYVADVDGLKVYRGFHLTRFLDDFMRYYTKSPNYARNMIYCNELVQTNIRMKPDQLYDYMLSHMHKYCFDVVSMQEAIDDGKEYVIVRCHAKSESPNMNSYRQPEEYDVILIITKVDSAQKRPLPTNCGLGTIYADSNTETVGDPKASLKLRYYIVMTSRYTEYPRLEEYEIGKFRDVTRVRGMSPKKSVDDHHTTTDLDKSTDSSDSDESVASTSAVVHPPNKRPRTSDESESAKRKHRKQSISESVTDKEDFSIFDEDTREVIYGDDLTNNEDATMTDAVTEDTVTEDSNTTREDGLNASCSRDKRSIIMIDNILHYQNGIEIVPCDEMESLFNCYEYPFEPLQTDEIIEISSDDSVEISDAESVNTIALDGTDLLQDDEMINIEPNDMGIDMTVETSNYGGDNTENILPATESQNSTDDETDDSSPVLGAGNTETAAASHVGIKPELVNYLGYYSSHEEVMQTTMKLCAEKTQEELLHILGKSEVDCRINLLWNQLLLPANHQTSLTDSQFFELLSLSVHKPAFQSKCEKELYDRALLRDRAPDWYLNLVRVLLNKYGDMMRTFRCADGSGLYYAILHTRYNGAFVLYYINLQTGRGELKVIARKPSGEETEVCLAQEKSLINGVIHCIAFFTWQGIVS